MKLVYLIAGTCRSGGMERVLANKVNYWVARGHEVLIVTTDQRGEPPFFPLDRRVRSFDLGINYEANNRKSFWNKLLHYPLKQWKHRKGLTALLKQEKPDITVSMFCNEVSFLTNIKDGSRKVLEIHFSKYKRLQYGRKGLWRLADRWFSIQEEKWVKRFDKFVVLTKEDQGYWGDLPNITVIPNALPETEGEPADMHSHRVLAVGRLDYQKGFERLVEAWEEVKKDKIFNDWRLDIFGKGECQDMLQQMIDERDLQDCLFLNQPTTAILDEYKKSSLLVMSSRYEGFPMVLLEAMSAGLPVVSFDCKCGPKDMIQDGRNGLLVKEGDISGLANAMKRMMAEVNFRICLSKEARKVSEYYSETIVMQQWKDLFETICRK